ncbi:hypothetical protein FQR65_LT15510 [Abscondita terminalis]|nr:hypothetical protein FQR65_LT15510 [Abscondita terminalis]
MKFSTEFLNLVHDNADTWNIIKNISLIKNNDDAFYFCDLNDVVQKLCYWQELMPNIQPFYAVKCNDDEYIIKVLAALGLGFHCCSTSSLKKVVSHQIESNRIIFANTTKPISFIQNAFENGVDLMTFDSKAELYKIKHIFPNARLVLRITYKAKALVELGRKFGCDAYTEAPKLLEIGRDLGLNIVGVSFHVGHGSQNIDAYYQSIKLARVVFDAAKSLGIDLNLLDIGGGFSGHTEDLKKCAVVINSAIEQFFPEKNIKIISEPGTYFVETAFKLVCNVHSLRDTLNKNGKKKFHYYLNDSIYGGFSNLFTTSLTRIPRTIKDHGNSPRYPSHVWGITNDSLDQINKNILLPELQIGEWLVYDDMGHYSLPCYSQFGGIEVPKIFRFISHSNWNLISGSSWFKT